MKAANTTTGPFGADGCPECASLDVEIVGDEFELSEEGVLYTVQSRCAACGASFEDVFALTERRPMAR